MFFEILWFIGALNGRFASLRRPATRLGRTNANAPLAERYGYIDARPLRCTRADAPAKAPFARRLVHERAV